jgi:hypothetical protein
MISGNFRGPILNLVYVHRQAQEVFSMPSPLGRDSSTLGLAPRVILLTTEVPRDQTGLYLLAV